MDIIKEDLKKQFEEKLRRELTDKELDFVSWIARRKLEVDVNEPCYSVK
ncbi:hypothetical protein JOD43_003770 [Pullulanibacillus pueri]|uniref:Uncharacterized protein n=1 Tax=Pullulanibacillus pueri TaxID=1437324 RepID=A0A8J3EMS5_9BACL|nr:hypothetical protein [Pullulanibacillus pueri]MBM7683590.1 hypothetical protein [Pullulanibacillus pueri]GGH84527.1 hypothetical protein GCM10007096_27810 [Pullulanibacillus pueri]